MEGVEDNKAGTPWNATWIASNWKHEIIFAHSQLAESGQKKDKRRCGGRRDGREDRVREFGEESDLDSRTFVKRD